MAAGVGGSGGVTFCQSNNFSLLLALEWCIEWGDRVARPTGRAFEEKCTLNVQRPLCSLLVPPGMHPLGARNRSYDAVHAWTMCAWLWRRCIGWFWVFFAIVIRYILSVPMHVRAVWIDSIKTRVKAPMVIAPEATIRLNAFHFAFKCSLFRYIM